MGNVCAKFERLKIGKSKSKLDAIHRQLVHRSYGVLSPYGPKSHKRASRRSNLLKNFHRYMYWASRWRTFRAKKYHRRYLSYWWHAKRLYEASDTNFLSSMQKTKARALESLPSMKHNMYMRSDLKTSPELMVVSRIGRKVHQLPSELLRKPALTSPDHITSGLQNHGTRVQLSSRILISPHCWWTLLLHPRSNSHDREAHSLNLTQQKQITWN